MLITLAGIELNCNPTGLSTHKIQILDEQRTWFDRQLEIVTMEQSTEIGFEISAITGKRHYLSYGLTDTTNIDIDQSLKYAKIIQTSFDINGFNMTLQEAKTIYDTYYINQTQWQKYRQYLQMLQDPELTKPGLSVIRIYLNSFSLDTISLNLLGTSYNVAFSEGTSCQFTNLVAANYTDFSFNLIAREYV